MKSENTKCLQCGGEIQPHPRTGIPTCLYCKRQYRDCVESFTYELQEIVHRRQMREFIQAEELCKELIHKQPNSGEAYWQMLLIGLGVVYVQEEENSKPTFFSYSYDDKESIKNNEYYKKALENARADDRLFYEEKGEELDTLLKEFFHLVSKESSYDVFISFKKSTIALVDGEERVIDTDDYEKAKEIYNYLKDKYKVFFSPVSIGNDTGIYGEKYEPRILKALQTSQAMILVGTKKEYLESQWVENEWRRYQYFINKGIKKKQSIMLGYFRSMPALPTALKDIQLPSFDMFKANYLKELEKELDFVKSSKAKKAKAQNTVYTDEDGEVTVMPQPRPQPIVAPMPAEYIAPKKKRKAGKIILILAILAALVATVLILPQKVPAVKDFFAGLFDPNDGGGGGEEPQKGGATQIDNSDKAAFGLLGGAFNTLSGKEMSADTVASGSVFDYSKLKAFYTNADEGAFISQDPKILYSQSASEMMKECGVENTEIGRSQLALNKAVCGFNTKFGLSVDYQSTQKKEEFLYSYTYKVVYERYRIEDTTDYSGVLSTAFLSSAAALDVENEEALKSFLTTYGTHILTAYKPILNCNFFYVSSIISCPFGAYTSNRT